MSWARALCHALATMWNGGLLFFLSCEIIRTGDIQIEVTQARALPTAVALILLQGIGSSLVCAIYPLLPSPVRVGGR